MQQMKIEMAYTENTIPNNYEIEIQAPSFSKKQQIVIGIDRT